MNNNEMINSPSEITALAVRQKIRILIISANKEYAKTIVESLDKSRYECVIVTSLNEFFNATKLSNYNIILADITSDELNSKNLIDQTRTNIPESEIVVVTSFSSMKKAIDALNAGAIDYFEKNSDMKLLQAKINKWMEKQLLRKTNIELQKQIDKKYKFENMIGKSKEMQKIFELIKQISDTSATVLLYGESGTGKELIAHAIHNNSGRRNNHFVPLNCASLSSSVLESELFGHEKGAFTGAFYTHEGRFEYADGGTLFLDEVCDIPCEVQVKLLRAIESREIFRVGSNKPIKVDARLIAATNKDLMKLVEEKKFREDLYFRLRVISINIPPLRERKEDIPLLVDAFLKEFSQLHKKPIISITPSDQKILLDYNWQGNVRELKNCLESMVITSKDSILDVEDIPNYIVQSSQETHKLLFPVGMSLADAEKELIKNTLIQLNGNRSKVAKALGVGERTLYRKIKNYNINID